MAQDESYTRGNSTAMDIETTMTNDELGMVKQEPDADEAMKAFERLQGQDIELDEATNRRLLRTIDWHIMPVMCLVYAMNFLDSMRYHSNGILPFSKLTQPRNYLVLRQCYGAERGFTFGR